MIPLQKQRNTKLSPILLCVVYKLVFNPNSEELNRAYGFRYYFQAKLQI